MQSTIILNGHLHHQPQFHFCTTKGPFNYDKRIRVVERELAKRGRIFGQATMILMHMAYRQKWHNPSMILKKSEGIIERSLQSRLFFNAESATHWNESVRKIELRQNFHELRQIFLQFCQNFAIFTEKNGIWAKITQLDHFS